MGQMKNLLKYFGVHLITLQFNEGIRNILVYFIEEKGYYQKSYMLWIEMTKLFEVLRGFYSENITNWQSF